MTSSVTVTRQHQKPARRNLSVGFARSEREILEAQKLRYHIFAGELGARLPTRQPGVDQDIYDPYCEHLVVRDENSGAVVGIGLSGPSSERPNSSECRLTGVYPGEIPRPRAAVRAFEWMVNNGLFGAEQL